MKQEVIDGLPTEKQVRILVQDCDQRAMPVTAEAIVAMHNEIVRLRALLSGSSVGEKRDG